MRYKNIYNFFVSIMASLILAFLIGSCSYSTAADNEKGKIGKIPTFYSSAYVSKDTDANLMAMIDFPALRLQEFVLEPLSLKRSFGLPFAGDDQSVIASANGQYFLVISGADYAIIRSDGKIDKNKVELPGTIESVAFDSAQNYLVLADKYQTVAVLSLNQSGEIIESWKGGPLVNDKFVMAGEMLDNGRLLFSLGETTLAVIDVAATLKNGSWTYTADVSEPFEIADAKSMTWIASVPDFPNLAVVLDSNRLMMIDLNTQAITGTPIDLTGLTQIAISKDLTPHVITSSSSQRAADVATIHYVNKSGNLVSQSLKITTAYLSKSFLDLDNDVLALSFDTDKDIFDTPKEVTYSEKEVFRYRLSDSMLMDQTEIKQQVKAGISPNYILNQFNSVLGYVERWRYGRDPQPVKLQNYNLKALRDKYD